MLTLTQLSEDADLKYIYTARQIVNVTLRRHSYSISYAQQPAQTRVPGRNSPPPPLLGSSPRSPSQIGYSVLVLPIPNFRLRQSRHGSPPVRPPPHTYPPRSQCYCPWSLDLSRRRRSIRLVAVALLMYPRKPYPDAFTKSSPSPP